MANQFLVEIHNHISRQIEVGLKDRAEAQSRGDHDRAVINDGKLNELQRIRAFLSKRFDLITQKYY